MSTLLPLETRSYWQKSAPVRADAHAPLMTELKTDVCIVGAGLGGLTTAYELARHGQRVVVLEAYEVGAGETGRTTAHIAVPDDRYAYIEDTHGRDAARVVAESFAAALDFIERTAHDERIDCEFKRVDGLLFSVADDARSALQRECDAARRAGVDVTFEARSPLEAFTAGACLRFPRQGQFHPLKYLQGLVRAIEAHGGAIYTGTRALEVEEHDDGVLVKTHSGAVRAHAVVLATNTPFHERFAMHTKQIAYQTYAVAAYLPRGQIPPVLIWDDGDPYHYVRTTPADDGHDLLIVGGADHKTGHAADPQAHYTAVEQWTRRRFPQVREFAHRWSGEVLEPLDGLAYLGRDPGSRHVFIITGDSGNGMTHATIGGLLISDLILGQPNPWTQVYDPARKPIKEALRYVKEQSSIAAQYADWLSGGNEESAAALAPGHGALIRMGLKKYAVYRDADGALHAHSAKCTHLGCIVHWNATEKSWDCPCHGSRFSVDGAPVHGPAVHALTAIDEDEWRDLVEEVSGEHRQDGAQPPTNSI